MKYMPMLIGIACCLAVGGISSLLQSDALQEWYPYLNKSSLTPPGAVFGAMWTFLYIVMGISIGLVWMRKAPGYEAITGLFIAQLAVNFLWIIGFFFFRSPWAGMADITLLLALLLCYMWRSYPHNRLSSLLFLPYLLWVAFAWYLNAYVVMHN